jgi:putative hydrolase of the HAD superfamily
MSIRAVFFDLGGVIVRTEYQSPREHLAERLNMDYDDLVRLVFESETSRKASIGQISAEEHWKSVARVLRRKPAEWTILRDEFFAGDVVDHSLLDFLRSLRSRRKTGLISNAWDDLRAYIAEKQFGDAFDAMIISAEAGMVKPKPGIFHMALDQLGVKPNEAVFVDDFIENVEGARAVGMKAIHFKEPEDAIQQVKQLLKR